MDHQMSLEDLKENSFALDVDYTVNELEWSKLVGANGLGMQLLQRMAHIGASVFQIDQIRHVENGDCEKLVFCVEDTPVTVRFNYDVPVTTTLLKGLRTLFQGVNGALRRHGVTWRFLLIRERSRKRGCEYRVMLVPTDWLMEVANDLRIVAGVSPEDYEFQPVTPHSRAS